MAFTVETGAVVAGANSYLALADANTYHSDRGNASWTGTDAVKQAALVKATDYLEQRYRTRWKGIRVDMSQALSWPRAGVQTEDYFEPSTDARESILAGLAYVVPEDTVPNEVKTATAELALDYLVNGDLNPSLARGGGIASEQVGPVAVSYFPGASGKTERPAIDGLLAPLLGGSSMTARLVRR